MWDRQFGNKSKELPEYSELASQPNHELPPELVQHERSEAFGIQRRLIEQELLHGPRRPSDDLPLLTAFLTARRDGLVMITLPNHGGQCLPVFTTPLRAADYRQVLLAPTGTATNYLFSAPIQFVKLLRDVEKGGIKAFAIDRCPRCAVFASFASHSVKTASDVIALWAIQKATELARARTYFKYALVKARTGHLAVARAVALATVGHVNMDEPRLHMLLGLVAVGLNDRTLLHEARTFLAFLKHDRWEPELEQAVQSGSPDFTMLE
jgi:hypothetical protein